MRGIDDKEITFNHSIPAYTFDGQNTSEVADDSHSIDDLKPGLIKLSNDHRLFDNENLYHFHDVESLDEDQRQRRRLKSARMSLLNANTEHISTMITTVFSTARNYITNQTVRSNVVRYLTQKMRSYGLVTGQQVFYPKEFEAMVDIWDQTFYLPQLS